MNGPPAFSTARFSTSGAAVRCAPPPRARSFCWRRLPTTLPSGWRRCSGAFCLAPDIGSPLPLVAERLMAGGQVDRVVRLDRLAATRPDVVADQEALPLAPASIDLAGVGAGASLGGRHARRARADPHGAEAGRAAAGGAARRRDADRTAAIAGGGGIGNPRRRGAAGVAVRGAPRDRRAPPARRLRAAGDRPGTGARCATPRRCI